MSGTDKTPTGRVLQMLVTEEKVLKGDMQMEWMWESAFGAGHLTINSGWAQEKRRGEGQGKLSTHPGEGAQCLGRSFSLTNTPRFTLLSHQASTSSHISATGVQGSMAHSSGYLSSINAGLGILRGP